MTLADQGVDKEPRCGYQRGQIKMSALPHFADSSRTLPEVREVP
jgi:hypothetical protein